MPVASDCRGAPLPKECAEAGNPPRPSRSARTSICGPTIASDSSSSSDAGRSRISAEERLRSAAPLEGRPQSQGAVGQKLEHASYLDAFQPPFRQLLDPRLLAQSVATPSAAAHSSSQQRLGVRPCRGRCLNEPVCARSVSEATARAHLAVGTLLIIDGTPGAGGKRRSTHAAPRSIRGLR